MKDSFILPPCLGGSGSLNNVFQDFPYITPPKHYHLYFTISMGFHVHALLHQIICNTKSNDYYEMILHHLVTIYLYLFSYMGNLLVGALVAFVHDVSDIFVCLSRTFGESEFKTPSYVFYCCLLISWLYTRLGVFPMIIYYSCIKLEVYAASAYVQPIFGFLLSCLFFLHIYWFILLLRILYYVIKKGEREDL